MISGGESNDNKDKRIRELEEEVSRLREREIVLMQQITKIQSS
jgi:hypothetical protein